LTRYFKAKISKNSEKFKEKPVVKEITDGNPANFFEFFDCNGKLLVILQINRK